VTEALPAEGAAEGEAQLELTPEPPIGPANDPLPPPEFHLPGEDDPPPKG
jgi:hypothetical protein